jgi:hypothetical protein
MISSQLISEAIIGCQLLKEYGINVNFEMGSINYAREGSFREQLFDQHPGQELSHEQSSEGNPVCNSNPTGQRPYSITADRSYPTPSTAVVGHKPFTEAQRQQLLTQRGIVALAVQLILKNLVLLMRQRAAVP